MNSKYTRLVSLNFAEFRVSRRAKTLNFAAFLLTRRVFELSEFLSETVDLRAGSWRVRGVMAESCWRADPPPAWPLPAVLHSCCDAICTIDSGPKHGVDGAECRLDVIDLVSDPCAQ